MKKKALLVDDSVTIHRVIDLSIDSEKFDVLKVFSAEEAGLKLSGESFDFILLDNKLEGVSVADYVEKLKNMQPDARIILLVGAFDRFGENELRNSGADDYLIKPFDSQSLNLKLAGVDGTDSEAADVYGASEPEDSMPAGFVERMSEADVERENDNAGSVPAPITSPDGSAAVDSSPLEEDYLNSLEDVHPDDMLEEGYAEDSRQFDDFTGIAEIPEEEVLTDEIPKEDAPARAENDFDPAEIEEAEFDGIGEIPAESVTEALPIYEEKELSDISLTTAGLNGASEVPEEFENAGLDVLREEPENIFSTEDTPRSAEEIGSLSDNVSEEALSGNGDPAEEISEDETEELSGESPEDDLNIIYDGRDFPEYSSDGNASDNLKAEEDGIQEEFSADSGGSGGDISAEPAQSAACSFPETEASERIVRENSEEDRITASSFSISISKDEIMSMIGAAIDKKIIETAVRDAIALHMGEIVKSIVPALAEKYIKEEIERLKNDE